jgi:hypothetical protein
MDRDDSREALEEQKLPSEELTEKEFNPTLPKTTIIVGNKYTLHRILSSPAQRRQKKATEGEEADGSDGGSRVRLRLSAKSVSQSAVFFFHKNQPAVFSASQINPAKRLESPFSTVLEERGSSGNRLPFGLSHVGTTIRHEYLVITACIWACYSAHTCFRPKDQDLHIMNKLKEQVHSNRNMVMVYLTKMFRAIVSKKKV